MCDVTDKAMLRTYKWHIDVQVETRRTALGCAAQWGGAFVAKQVKRTWSIASAFAVAVLMLGAATAHAHKTSFETEVRIDAVYYSGPTVTVAGYVSSLKAECVPNRTVQLIAAENLNTPDQSDDRRTVVDTDRTSLNGAYRVRGDRPPGTDYTYVRVTQKNIGSSGHRHICQADTNDLG